MENQFLDGNMETSLNENGGLTGQDKAYLMNAAKWSRFMGIVTYVVTGFLILGGILSMVGFSALSALGGGVGAMMLLFYFLLAVLYFFLAKYLYDFGTKTKAGIEQNSGELLTEGLKNLSSHFTLTGILIAIVVGIYALVFVFAMLFGGMAALTR